MSEHAATPTRDDVRLMKAIYGENSDEYYTALANCSKEWPITLPVQCQC